MPEGKTYTNAIGMKFVRVEPGRFIMGSNSGDFDERPTHQVMITEPLYVAVTQVANAQYERFDPSHAQQRGRFGVSRDDDEPAVFVSHDEASAFCQWLRDIERLPYRLPTEAEWEYACRAGTTTAYHTGEKLPKAYQQHQIDEWNPIAVSLSVGKTPANTWGLHDMHGHVEEWCFDWYGPYESEAQTDPVGRAGGDFRVTRGGSYGTDVCFLRSANRAGTLAQDKHWLIGFRVVIADRPPTKPLPVIETRLWAKNVRQQRHNWQPPSDYDSSTPFFKGPIPFVKIPSGSDGPMFSKHNHQPALAACPNGDLLAIWYSTRRESGRELAVLASRLRKGRNEWDQAAPFWDAPDRNDHGSDLYWDGKDALYHFNGLSHSAGWSSLALIMRKSTDNGVTWSKARLIRPEHEVHHQVIAGAFATHEGHIVLKCDAGPGGDGGTVLHFSPDDGRTWQHPAENRPKPKFASGESGASIAGIHAAVTELESGALLAFGRGDAIDGHIPQSISYDLGRTWTYQASPFMPIGGGQRLQLIRLREGSLLLISFASAMDYTNQDGGKVVGQGIYSALSFDDGETWPTRKLMTDVGGSAGKTMLGVTTEPRGYLAVTQTPDGIIHLLSSRLYYAFNLAWLKAT